MHRVLHTLCRHTHPHPLNTESLTVCSTLNVWCSVQSRIVSHQVHFKYYITPFSYLLFQSAAFRSGRTTKECNHYLISSFLCLTRFICNIRILHSSHLSALFPFCGVWCVYGFRMIFSIPTKCTWMSCVLNERCPRSRKSNVKI